MSTATKASEAFIGLLGLISAAVIGYIWGGYVFSVLWAWFVVTAFAAPPLGIAQAIGVTMAARFVFVKWKPEKDDSKPWDALLGAFVTPLLFLAVGWIVKQWVPA